MRPLVDDGIVQPCRWLRGSTLLCGCVCIHAGELALEKSESNCRPLSVVMFSRVLKRDTHCDTRVLAIVTAVISGRGNASTQVSR